MTMPEPLSINITAEHYGQLLFRCMGVLTAPVSVNNETTTWLDANTDCRSQGEIDAYCRQVNSLCDKRLIAERYKNVRKLPAAAPERRPALAPKAKPKPKPKPSSLAVHLANPKPKPAPQPKCAPKPKPKAVPMHVVVPVPRDPKPATQRKRERSESPDLVGIPDSSDDESYEGDEVSVHSDDTSLYDVLWEDKLFDVPLDD